MLFDTCDKQAIRAALYVNDFTGRWEGRKDGSPISIWIEGQRGSRKVCFVVTTGAVVRYGFGHMITEVLVRVDAILRARSDADEAYGPAPRPANYTTAASRRTRPNISPSPTRANGNGTRHTLMGYGLCRVLQWMGAHGYNQYDALNALEHHGLSGAISKKTISRAMDKGKNPERDGIEVINLPDNVIATLEPFRGLAQRES